MSRVFEEIKIGSVGVTASGGLVDISRPEDMRGADKVNSHQRIEQRSWLGMAPANARRLAAAIIKAADACDGLPSEFES